MKRGPFAPGGLCCPADQHYYDPLRLPLDRPHHFPGSPVIGGASLPAAPQATGPRRLSRVPRTTVRTFNAQYAGGFLSARSWTKSAFRGLRRGRTGSAPPFPRLAAGLSDDACSGFTRVADRAVDPAPLRTRPLGHARGPHYQGPRRLPGPDSHRQAALNLSLLRHAVLPSSWRQSGPGALVQLRSLVSPPFAVAFACVRASAPTPDGLRATVRARCEPVHLSRGASRLSAPRAPPGARRVP
jgi:hypothetical protein